MRKAVLLACLCLACLFLALSGPSSTSAGPSVRSPQGSGAAAELLEAAINEMELQDSLLAGYRYSKTIVVESLGNDLERKKSEERLIDVTSIPHGPDIEVLVAVNGKRVSDKDQQKSKAEQERRSRRNEEQLSLSSEDLITQFNWSLAGTERVNGRPAAILSFKPKPGAIYKGKDQKAEKFIRRIAGRVWVDDVEHAISRIEFHSTEPVKSLGGLAWTLDSLFVREERQRLPEGVWIDSIGESFVDARALLVKRIRSRSTSHTHNYRRGPDSPAPPLPDKNLLPDTGRG